MCVSARGQNKGLRLKEPKPPQQGEVQVQAKPQRGSRREEDEPKSKVETTILEKGSKEKTSQKSPRRGKTDQKALAAKKKITNPKGA